MKHYWIFINHSTLTECVVRVSSWIFIHEIERRVRLIFEINFRKKNFHCMRRLGEYDSIQLRLWKCEHIHRKMISMLYLKIMLSFICIICSLHELADRFKATDKWTDVMSVSMGHESQLIIICRMSCTSNFSHVRNIDGWCWSFCSFHSARSKFLVLSFLLFFWHQSSSTL